MRYSGAENKWRLVVLVACEVRRQSIQVGACIKTYLYNPFRILHSWLKMLVNLRPSGKLVLRWAHHDNILVRIIVIVVCDEDIRHIAESSS